MAKKDTVNKNDSKDGDAGKDDSTDEALKSLVKAQKELLSKMDFMADVECDPYEPYEEVETDEFGNCVSVVVYDPPPDPLLHEHAAAAYHQQAHHHVTPGSDHSPSLNVGDDDLVMDDMSLHSSDLELDQCGFPDDDDGFYEEAHRSCPAFSRNTSAFDSYKHQNSAHSGDYHRPSARYPEPYHFGHSSWGAGHWKCPPTNVDYDWRMRGRANTGDPIGSRSPAGFPSMGVRDRANTEGSIRIFREPQKKRCFQSSFSSETEALTASASSFDRADSGRSWESRRSTGSGTKRLCQSVQFLSLAKSEDENSDKRKSYVAV